MQFMQFTRQGENAVVFHTSAALPILQKNKVLGHYYFLSAHVYRY
jgi:hypothetical protein